MNKYSQQSALNLQQCPIVFQLICHELLEQFDHSVLCSFRGKIEQNELFRAGKSKVKYPNSKHNSIPPMAVDLAPYPRERNIHSDREKYCEMAGRFLAIAHRLLKNGIIDHKVRWGRNWDGDKEYDDQDFNDYGHFEIIEV